jgi:hypothetical protein
MFGGGMNISESIIYKHMYILDMNAEDAVSSVADMKYERMSFMMAMF